MSITYKSTVQARQLAEALQLRLGLAVAVDRDAAGNPVIKVGTLATTTQSAYIKIKPDYDPSPFENGIGMTQRVYTPHVIQLLIENGGAVTGVGDSIVLTVANYSKILFELSQIGMKVEVYEQAAGALVDGGIAPANLKTTLDSLYAPLVSTL